jgi:serine/threonine protein kinase/tetratricopeptide (TPR) repeat protein
VSTAKQDARLSELLDEYGRAVREGRAPDREAFLAAHPDLRERLAAAVVGLEFIRRASPDLASAPAEPPGQLGDFRILGEIGRGGMGVVYEAEQISLNRRVALKVLPFASVLDPKQLQRFRNEAQAAAHLHHTNIVPVHAVGSERGVHYYAMQFIEGESLARAIAELRKEGRGPGGTPISSHTSNREPAFLRMAAKVGMQAAEALDHAHQLGVVHRDVKPGNLLVDFTGNLWITDFGLARFDRGENLTMTGDLVGTLRYMSPEQALGKRVPIDHRTDVYSLGATLYELFTLEPAVTGQDPQAVIQEIAFKDPKPPRRLNPAVPPDLETILLKSMAKDPTARYASAQEMADDLRRFLEHKPIVARRPSLATVAQKWVRRHRPLVGAAVAALVVSVVVLVASNLRTARALRQSEARLATAREAVDLFLTFAGIGRPSTDRPLSQAERIAFYERALDLCDRQSEDTNDIREIHARARILAELGLDESIAAYAQRRLSLTMRACWWIANVLVDGRDEEALLCLDRVQAVDPDCAPAFAVRGRALSNLDRHAEALAAFDRALELSSGTPPRLLNLRACALVELGRYAEALAAVDDALHRGLNDWDIHANRATLLNLLGRHAEAVAATDLALVLDPNCAIARSQRAEGLFNLNRLTDALEACDRALDLNPDDANAHAIRAQALIGLRRIDEALRAIDGFIELEPKNVWAVWAYSSRARVLNCLGRYADALAACDQASALDPNCVHAHTQRSAALCGLGQLDDALVEIDRALDLAPAGDPGGALAHAMRGSVLRKLRRHEEALEASDRALQSDRDCVMALGERGLVLKALGRASEALAVYERAIGLDPGDAVVHNNLAWLRATSDVAGIRDVNEAVTHALEAVRLDPSGNHHNTLGVAFYRAGCFKECIDALSKSVELRSGGDAFDFFFLAMAHGRLGEKERAREWYDRGVAWTEKNRPEDEDLRRFRAEAAELLGVSVH